MVKYVVRVGILAVAAALATPSVAQVFVGAGTSSPTLIGTVVAGQSYQVTATGNADLFAAFNGGQGVPFNANGVPTYAIPAPYSGFYPSGLDYDPSQNTSAYGIGGPGHLFGSLLGTYTASPSGYSSYFQLGTSAIFTASTSGNLYAVVNDCPNCYFDNGAQTGFNVTLTALVSGVPEPSSWVMMLLGFGAIGYTMRRRPRIRLPKAA